MIGWLNICINKLVYRSNNLITESVHWVLMKTTVRCGVCLKCRRRNACWCEWPRHTALQRQGVSVRGGLCVLRGTSISPSRAGRQPTWWLSERLRGFKPTGSRRWGHKPASDFFLKLRSQSLHFKCRDLTRMQPRSSGAFRPANPMFSPCPTNRHAHVCPLSRAGSAFLRLRPASSLRTAAR